MSVHTDTRHMHRWRVMNCLFLPARLSQRPSFIYTEPLMTLVPFVSIRTIINDLGWPWIDLERLLCALLHYTRLSEPTTKIWKKIDPYHQQQKCSPWIAVTSEIKFMRIFGGVRWRGGFKWEWGPRKWRFSLILPAISSEPSHLRPQLLYYAM